MLIASRAIAGMGGGGIMTVANISLTDLIPLLYGAGAGLGGPLGGWINQVVPLLLLCMTIIVLRLDIPLSEDVRRQSKMEKLRRIDWLGALTLVTGVGSLLLGFSLKTSEDLEWTNLWVWIPLVTSVLALVSFVLVEAYFSVAPIMPLRILKERTPLAIAIGNLYYFATVKLKASSEAGAHLLPNSVAVSLGSLFAGWYISISRSPFKLGVKFTVRTGSCDELGDIII
ncbi:hypothetical protein Clacol_007325 [Clathrus columnatus]|uniref:Uncharacterized protein n=1 Tax=Clathrus columnatus TaxID=1419009 RepID=A0AAV5AMB8_9AGAM|nr:hypothetical protein Clacol_007325 [Clathrus columnatus]